MNIKDFVSRHQMRDSYKAVSFELRLTEREKLQAICARYDVSQGNLLRAIVLSWLSLYEQDVSK